MVHVLLVIALMFSYTPVHSPYAQPTAPVLTITPSTPIAVPNIPIVYTLEIEVSSTRALTVSIGVNLQAPITSIDTGCAYNGWAYNAICSRSADPATPTRILIEVRSTETLIIEPAIVAHVRDDLGSDVEVRASVPLPAYNLYNPIVLR